MNNNYLIWGLVAVAIVVGLLMMNRQSSLVNKPQPKGSSVGTSKTAVVDYNPIINPNDFVAKIDNKYFTLTPGTKITYQKKTEEGNERIDLVVTNETKKIMGVTTTLVQDTVYLNDKLKEDTKDWYAQDKMGNVWYFAEAVDNFENGKLADHKGSFEAGVDGAKPGIIMKANPQIGDNYRQEYYKGVAEDYAQVVALDKTITIAKGTYKNCLQTKDKSYIDLTLDENKYYCPDVGYVTLEEKAVKGGLEKLELVSVLH